MVQLALFGVPAVDSDLGSDSRVVEDDECGLLGPTKALALCKTTLAAFCSAIDLKRKCSVARTNSEPAFHRAICCNAQITVLSGMQ